MAHPPAKKTHGNWSSLWQRTLPVKPGWLSTCRRITQNHRLYTKMDDIRVRPKHLDHPLVVRCGVGRKAFQVGHGPNQKVKGIRWWESSGVTAQNQRQTSLHLNLQRDTSCSVFMRNAQKLLTSHRSHTMHPLSPDLDCGAAGKHYKCRLHRLSTAWHRPLSQHNRPSLSAEQGPGERPSLR